VGAGKQTLGILGYNVTIRKGSIEALELFWAKPDQFDLVITDMTMPHMTGDKLAQEIIKFVQISRSLFAPDSAKGSRKKRPRGWESKRLL